MSNRFSKLLASALILLSPAALALDTGWIYAGSATNVVTGDASWTNTANATGDNTGTYSSVSLGSFDLSDSIQLTNFNFAALPDSATIDGIQVAIYRQRTGGDIVDDTVRLVIEGSVVGANKGVGSTIPTVAAEATYGGASDKWSLTPTAAQLKASNSGVRIAYENTGSSADARVYRVGIKIYYTPAVADWWDTSWSHAIEGTIDAAYVDEEIPVVPVWIPSSATSWFSAVQADGDDIRVLNSNDTIMLEHYLVSIDTGSPYCMLLVNVAPIIDTVTDAPLRIYAGNASAASTSSSSDVFTSTNYAAYYLPGMTTTDLTGNGYTLTATGTPGTAASDWDGLTAATYNGSSQYHGYDGAPVTDWPMSLEAVVAPSAVSGTKNIFSASRSNSASNLSAIFQNGSSLTGGIQGNTGSAASVTVSTSFSTDVYDFISVARDGTTGVTRARNSESTASNTTTITSLSSLDRVTIGAARYASGISLFWNGAVSMAAQSSVARSDNFTGTHYDAWFTSGFITFGAVETAPSSGSVELWRGLWFE